MLAKKKPPRKKFSKARRSKFQTQMSQAKQRRTSHLLFRNREDDLCRKEKAELEVLVLEAQVLTLIKALLMLQRSRKSK